MAFGFAICSRPDFRLLSKVHCSFLLECEYLITEVGFPKTEKDAVF